MMRRDIGPQKQLLSRSLGTLAEHIKEYYGEQSSDDDS